MWDDGLSVIYNIDGVALRREFAVCHKSVGLWHLRLPDCRDGQDLYGHNQWHMSAFTRPGSRHVHTKLSHKEYIDPFAVPYTGTNAATKTHSRKFTAKAPRDVHGQLSQNDDETPPPPPHQAAQRCAHKPRRPPPLPRKHKRWCLTLHPFFQAATIPTSSPCTLSAAATGAGRIAIACFVRLYLRVGRLIYEAICIWFMLKIPTIPACSTKCTVGYVPRLYTIAAAVHQDTSIYNIHSSFLWLYVVSCTHLVSWSQCLANDEKENYSRELLRYGTRYFRTTICSVHWLFRPSTNLSANHNTAL